MTSPRIPAAFCELRIRLVLALVVALWTPQAHQIAEASGGLSGDAETRAGQSPFLHCRGRGGACEDLVLDDGDGDSGAGSGAGGGEAGGENAEAAPTLCYECGGGGPGGGGMRRFGGDSGGANEIPTNGKCCVKESNKSSAGSDYTSASGSIVDNSYFSYKHAANDVAEFETTGLRLTRYHRSRDLFKSGGFGQGIVNTFDVKLRIAMPNENPDFAEMGEVYNFESTYISSPNSDIKIGFNTDWYEDNVLLPTDRNRTEKLEILDGQMAPYTHPNHPDEPLYYYSPPFPGAKYARLTTWDGGTYLFELVLASADSAWDEELHHPPDGRLIAAKTRDGHGYDITYKSWTMQEISESPSRQWQIDSVIDTQGRTLAFVYDSIQHAGNWVITTITLPDNDEIHYRYANGFLSEIEYPDSTVSTFSFSQSTGGLVRMHFNDLKAAPQHRKKTAVFTGAASVSGNDVVPTAIGMVRIVRNGEDELTYFNYVLQSDYLGIETPEGSSQSFFESVIYEGGGKLAPEVHFASSGSDVPKRYFTDGWQMDLDGLAAGIYDPYDPNWEAPFSGTLESRFVEYFGFLANVLRGNPDGIIDERGISRSFQYAVDPYAPTVVAQPRNRSRTDYSDDTFEAYCYNARHQVTRYRDREGNVTRTTYDSEGRRTQLEVGLTDSSTNVDVVDPYTSGSSYNRCATDDVQTAEYALTQWQYVSSGNGIGQLAKYIDPRGNETDYQYNAQHRLSKVTGPALVASGPRAETSFTYDSLGRVKTVTDPLEHTTEYFYDWRGRVISALHDDGTTDRTIYGTSGAATGLVQKTIDRAGVVTTYEYDAADRLIRRTSAAAQMDGSTETATPEIAIEETWAYLNGTSDPTEHTRAGTKTAYVYDYRGRRIQTTVTPRDGVSLVTNLVYVDNKLFSSEDPYGRKTYYVYDATDGRLIRSVTGATAEFSVADFAAALNLIRDDSVNGTPDMGVNLWGAASLGKPVPCTKTELERRTAYQM